MRLTSSLRKGTVTASLILGKLASYPRQKLRNKGIEVKEEYHQHLSPLGWEHINLTGDFQWNVKQLPPLGQLRSLRTKTA